MKMRELYVVVTLAMWMPGVIMSQNIITVDDSRNVDDLVKNVLVKNGSEVSQVTSKSGATYNHKSIGYFEAGNSNFPIEKGIILTTGKAKSAAGTNTKNNPRLGDGGDQWPGDNDIKNILNYRTGSKNKTKNASIIEFCFVPLSNHISFDYIFASEEYNTKYECTPKYQDGFAFIIRGPGIVNDKGIKGKNIALVPGTTDVPVSTGTVRSGLQPCSAQNKNYFVSHGSGKDYSPEAVAAPIRYNGRTVVFTARADVIPGEEYHIKLVVADRGDNAYDSAVFLAGDSFDSGLNLGEDRKACIDEELNSKVMVPNATFRWYRDGHLIPGATKTTYKLAQNDLGMHLYKVEVTVGSATFTDEVQITTSLLSATALIVGAAEACEGRTFTLATSAKGKVHWESSNPEIAKVDPISGTVTAVGPGKANITYTVTDGNKCPAKSAVHTITVHPLPATPVITGNSEMCKDSSIALATVATGKVHWESSDPLTAQVDKISGLVSGVKVGTADIAYTVTDTNGCVRKSAKHTITVHPLPSAPVITGAAGLCIGESMTLTAAAKGKVHWKSSNPQIAEVDIKNGHITTVSAGTTDISCTVTDGNGCITKSAIHTVTVHPLPIINPEEVVYKCSGEKIVLDAGDIYMGYKWSTEAETRHIEIDEPGIYRVVVRSGFGCEASKEITVEDFPPAKITAVIDTKDSLEVQLETPDNYQYSLDNLYYQQSPVFNNLAPGVYTIYVRDNKGCNPIIKKSSIIGVSDFFTPNGDGYNDFWKPKGLELHPKALVSIFDRYGRLMKHFQADSKGWDGSYLGRKVVSDDYWYRISLKDGRVFKGHFSLKRR